MEASSKIQREPPEVHRYALTFSIKGLRRIVVLYRGILFALLCGVMTVVLSFHSDACEPWEICIVSVTK